MHTLPRRPTLARALVVLGGLGHLGTQVGTHLGVEWIGTWFYELAWWTLIPLVDGLVHLRAGRSLLIDRPRAFLLSLPWSAAFWLFFELVNLRLENWYYVGVPADALQRWLGTYIAFATVFPAVFETDALLRSLLPPAGPPGRAFAPTHGRRRLSSALGVAFLGLPLLDPTHFYPLVWGSVVLLGEPWLVARHEPGLWSALAQGRWRAPLRLFASGVVVGLLWEGLNAGAGAKWIYTVPFFEETKLFEMPPLGFVGFAPFALECYTFTRLLVAWRWLPEWEPERPPRRVPTRRALLAALAALAVSVPMAAAMMQRTVRASEPLLSDLPAAAGHLAELERAGLRRARDLLSAEERGTLAGLVPPWVRAALVAEARLATLRGLGGRGLAWLRSVGVRDVDSLAARDPDALVSELSSNGAGPAPPPTPREVRVWCRAARRRVGGH